MELVCIVCPNSCKLSVEGGEVKGAKCARGIKFGKEEMTAPVRTICTTVKTTFKDTPVLPVRTKGDIPKARIFEFMKLVNGLTVNSKLKRGDVIIKDVLGTGVDVIATADL